MAIFAIAFGANAQKSSSSASSGFKFGIGPRVGIVVGDYDQIFGFVAGGELQGEYMFSPQASATLTTGYTNFSGKSGYGSTGFIPVLAGVRYYPSNQFFVSGRIGLNFSTESGGGSWFTYEPQVGYNMDKFQLALGYQGASKSGFTLAHLGVTGIIKLN